MLRRLHTFKDPTFDGLAPFDSVRVAHPKLELHLLNEAYRYLSETLEANAELSSSGLLTADIMFDIVDEPSINAFAWHKEGCDAICITSGLVIALYLIFSRIAQFPESFPWVPAASPSGNVPPPLNEIPTSVTHLQNEAARDFLTGRPFISPIPQDKRRSELVTYLWKWSLLFTIFHELGHVLRGHTDFLSHQRSLTSLSEVKGKHTKWWRTLIQRQTLGSTWVDLRRGQEKEADRFAVVGTFLPLYENTSLLPDYLATVGSDGYSRMPYAWSFAVGTLFTLFAHSEQRAAGRRSVSTHPTPYERLVVAVLSPETLVVRDNQFPNLDMPTLGLVTMEAWRDLDDYLKLVFGAAFQPFFAGSQYVIPLDLEAVTQDYAGHAQWLPYDRIKRCTRKESLRVVFPL